VIDEAERWVSVEDVAAHLGVARDSVYRWIEGRGLPAHRIGRLLKFKLSEVDAWVRHDGQPAQDVKGPENLD
jgi:excisionase family DNA binding protein